MKKDKKLLKVLIVFFIVVLFLSGLTAIPTESEIFYLLKVFESNKLISEWLGKVYTGIHDSNQRYPFLFYGYDWLAFAHFVLAILFIGPLRNPIKNKWTIEFGIIACAFIIPFALIAGHFRGIPLWWRLIDCSFGVLGIFLLGFCLYKIRILEKSVVKKN